MHARHFRAARRSRAIRHFAFRRSIASRARGISGADCGDRATVCARRVASNIASTERLTRAISSSLGGWESWGMSAISRRLLVGFVGRRRRKLVGHQFRPDQVPGVGAQVAPCNTSLCRFFDRRTSIRRDRPYAISPLADKHRGNIKNRCKLRSASGFGEMGVKVHAVTIAFAIGNCNSVCQFTNCYRQ